MKRTLTPLLAVFSLIVGVSSAAPSCCTPPTAAATPAPASASAEAKEPEAAAKLTGHALRGVIVAVMAEKSALLVKHEEIPGVMRAMTMLLKVDAPTLAAAKKDEAITATLVKKADGWWLEDVRPAERRP